MLHTYLLSHVIRPPPTARTDSPQCGRRETSLLEESLRWSIAQDDFPSVLWRKIPIFTFRCVLLFHSRNPLLRQFPPVVASGKRQMTLRPHPLQGGGGNVRTSVREEGERARRSLRLPRSSPWDQLTGDSPGAEVNRIYCLWLKMDNSFESP